MPALRERIIASRYSPFPAPPSLAEQTAYPLIWRSFSWYWWGVVQGLISGLDQPYLWEDLTDDVYAQITQLYLPQIPECEECPEPSEPIPVVSLGSIMIGESGLTIEELEEQLAMAITKLEWRNGVLWARDGCCDWYVVAGQSGEASPYVGADASDLGLDEWMDAGKPEIPGVPVPHQDPIYTTDDSLKCAKATAIVNEFYNVISGFNQAFQTVPDSLLSIAGLSTVLFGFFPIAVPAFSMLTGLIGLFSKFAAADWITRLSAVEANTEQKEALICDLVPRMATPVQIGLIKANLLTAQDIATALDRFEALVTHHASVRDLLGVFSTSGWQEVVVPQLETEGCGCEQYLPFGYVPPSQAGAINFDRFVFSGTTATVLPAGLPFEVLEETPRQGSRAGDVFHTSYAGIVTGSGNRVYHRCSMLFHCDNPVLIQEVRMDVTPLGNVGTANFDGGLRIFNDVGGWGGVVQPLATDVTAELIMAHEREGQWILVTVKVDDLAAPDIRATIENLVFTGEIDGVPFYQKAVGEVLA